MKLEYHHFTVSGKEIVPHLLDVAQLRISVFREFPYLYDGDLDYEKKYLATYARQTQSFLVLVQSGATVIGASTATPLIGENSEMQDLFEQFGYPTDRVLYLGESVLLPPFRGLGIGHIFFEERESYARSLGMNYTAFCAVIRENNHPLRPTNYTPLNNFWLKKGYEKIDNMTISFNWKDVDQPKSTTKAMQFWVKKLKP